MSAPRWQLPSPGIVPTIRLCPAVRLSPPSRKHPPGSGPSRSRDPSALPSHSGAALVLLDAAEPAADVQAAKPIQVAETVSQRGMSEYPAGPAQERAREA